MAEDVPSNDSLVASFWTKYHYKLWRPETAIFEGNLDGNAKTDADLTLVPYILTPRFPSYNLRRAKHSGNDDEGDNDDEQDTRSHYRD